MQQEGDITEIKIASFVYRFQATVRPLSIEFGGTFGGTLKEASTKLLIVGALEGDENPSPPPRRPCRGRLHPRARFVEARAPQPAQRVSTASVAAGRAPSASYAG
jgi:hypothetical protein